MKASNDRSTRSWRLVERYVDYSREDTESGRDWRCVFQRDETTLDVSVPEDVWRAFDGIRVGT